MRKKNVFGLAVSSLALLFAFALTGCPGVNDSSDPPAQDAHLAMLKSLGIRTDGTKSLDPMGNALPASYNPLGAASGGQGGKAVLYPQRELFVAGMGIDGKWNGIYEDLDGKNSLDLTSLWTSGGAGSWDHKVSAALPKKALAADFDGDGFDEVLVVVVNIDMANGLRGDGKITLYTADYNTRKDQGFQEIRQFAYDGTKPLNEAFGNADKYLESGWSWENAHIRIDMAAGDLDGDGKAEAILAIADTVYLLDDNFREIGKIKVPQNEGSFNYLQVATADYDQDGTDEWILVKGTSKRNTVAGYTIYKGISVMKNGSIQGDNTYKYLRTANVVTGDFNGDGLPDTAFYGKENRDSNVNYYLNVMLTAMDSDSKPTWPDTLISSNYILAKTMGNPGDNEGWQIPGLAAGDMDMDGRDEIFATRQIFTLDPATNKLVKPRWWAPDKATYLSDVEYDYCWMGDITGDKRADIVMVPTNSTQNWIQVFSYDGSTFNGGDNYNLAWQKQFGGSNQDFPAICLPNVDNDSYVLEYQGSELLFTDPIIQVVIASPPYWENANNENGGTTYGKSSSSGSSESHSGGFKVGFSVGYEFDSGIFGNSGASVKGTMEHGFNWGVSKSKEISESWSYSTGVGEDKVVFTAIPYDVYYYKIISAPDKADENGKKAKVGGIMTINIPRKPGTYNQELTYYNEHNGETWDVELPHTLGNPFSYAKESDLPGLKTNAGNRGLFTTTSNMNVGVTSTGTTSQSVEQVTTEEKSFDYELELGIEAETKVAGVTIGASAKFGYGYGFSNSTSAGIFIEGEVPDIPQNKYSTDLDFRWGLLMYPMSGPGQSFNLVTYWVDQ